MFRRALLVSGVALAACVSHTENSELTGRASLAIASVPSNVSCIQVTGATSNRSSTDSFDVTAGQSTVLELNSVPTGTVTFTGAAFATSCAGVTAASTPDWTGAPVTAVITSTSVTPITLVLTPNGQTAVTVDFEDGGVTDAASTCANPSTCTAAVAAGAIPLSCGYAAATVPGSATPGGYTFSFNDTGGSTACVDSTAFCASGSSVAQNPTFTNFGGGVGVNLNQPSAAPSPIDSLSLTGTTGISYAVSNIPADGLRLSIESGGTSYCANLTSVTGTVPWADFNTECFDTPPTGTALTGAPTAATNVEFLVPSSTTTEAWSFCVETLTFAL
jgi:hypothetical protein